MENMLFEIIIVALLAAFMIILANKWGLIEHLQIHGNKFFNELANCNFCLSFWVGYIISVTFLIITGDFIFLLIPFFSTPLTRILL